MLLKIKTILFLGALFLFTFLLTFYCLGWIIKTDLLANEKEMNIDVNRYKDIGDIKSHPLQDILNQLSIISSQGMTPPEVARTYAYVSSLYHDVLLLHDDSREASIASIKLIKFLLPDNPEMQKVLSNFAPKNDELSKPVLTKIKEYEARAKNDNYATEWKGTIPKGEDKWFSKTGILDTAINAGAWKPWVVYTEPVIPPPPSWKSFADKLEMEKMLASSEKQKSGDYEKVAFWQLADKFENGRFVATSVVDAWNTILFVELGQELDEKTLSNAQKNLAQAITDALIYTWRVKYRYWSMRPSMRIPNLRLVNADPPYPGYVSELASASYAAATVLTAMFPEKEETWIRLAKAGANSGFAGGLYFDSDTKWGKQLGLDVGVDFVKEVFPDRTDKIKRIKESYREKRFEDFWKLSLFQLQQRIQNSNFFQTGNPSAFIDVFDSAGLYKKGTTLGIAWVDINNDGFDDLFIITAKKGANMYRNNHNGTFTDITADLFPQLISGSFYAGSFGDYDNDGCPDLFITTAAEGSDKLTHNNCDGTFTDVSEHVEGLDKNGGRKALSWVDYNNDGYLDLYVTLWGSDPVNGVVNYYPNRLYKNMGNGTFKDVAKEAGVLGTTNCDTKNTLQLKSIGGPLKNSFQPIWFDYNNDGWLDLFIATDNGISPLYKNLGNGKFKEVTSEAGLCKMGTGMGVSVGDYNNDGFLDLYVTNTGQHYFWRNNGNGTFSEISLENGTNDSISVGWGANFFDYDNDGYLDLYVVNGAVRSTIENIVVGKIMFDKLFHNDGNTFTDVSFEEGLFGNFPKFPGAIADYNNDGFVDVFVGGGLYDEDERSQLYKNGGNSNHWIAIKLIGTKSNRDAIGARIILVSQGKKQIREVVNGSSYISQDSLVQTFGLGNTVKIDDLEVHWSSGITQTFHDLTSTRKIIIKEGGETIIDSKEFYSSKK